MRPSPLGRERRPPEGGLTSTRDQRIAALAAVLVTLALATARPALAGDEGPPGAPPPDGGAPPPDPAPAGAAPRFGEDVTVVAPARLPRPTGPADGISLREVAGDELRRSGARGLQDALRRIPGLNLNDEQGNTLQQDLSLRGLVASPVTGLSQGLSVYLDGVRVNEPGGEEVNFDLLPLADVERVELVRGPNAIFGRNTLGGAVNLVTRRAGRTAAGEVTVEGGSFGYQQVQARAAGPLGPLDGMLSLGEATERGWREVGASRVLRGFGKVGFTRGATNVGLSYQAQVDRLEQPGSLPLSTLIADRSANYTAGDFFRPALHLVTLNARQALADGITVAVNAHARLLDSEQFNASWVAPDTRMRNRTRTMGGVLQLEHEAHLGPVRTAAVAGVEATRSTVRIRVDEEANARFATDEQGGPLPARIGDLADVQLALGAFAQEHLRVTRGPLAGVGATAALRFDRIAHEVVDTSPPSPGAADGSAAYARWVPAAGLFWAFDPRASISASWSEGFRAPAFLELTCADPAAPCVGLQAGVAPDATFTRLRPVRSRTFAAGVAAAPLDGLSATVTAFRVDLRNDIYSVVGADTTLLYFRNVGDTRRQGLEASLRGEAGPASLEIGYAFTRATFESSFTLATPRVASGTEEVHPGNRLPLVPEHQLDVAARLRPLRWLQLSAGVHWVGPQRFRGDEANVAPRLAGYALVRAGVELRWSSWTASLQAMNLLDARYETFGTYAINGRSGGGIEPFLTPGQPLRVWLALRWGAD